MTAARNTGRLGNEIKICYSFENEAPILMTQMQGLHVEDIEAYDLIRDDTYRNRYRNKSDIIAPMKTLAMMTSMQT